MLSSKLLYSLFISHLCYVKFSNKFHQLMQLEMAKIDKSIRGNRLYDIRKLRAEVFGKIEPSSGKRVNGSALPPRLTDWKGNPFAIRSVLIRSDSRHTCIRFGFPAPRSRCPLWQFPPLLATSSTNILADPSIPNQ